MFGLAFHVSASGVTVVTFIASCASAAPANAIKAPNKMVFFMRYLPGSARFAPTPRAALGRVNRNSNTRLVGAPLQYVRPRMRGVSEYRLALPVMAVGPPSVFENEPAVKLARFPLPWQK